MARFAHGVMLTVSLKRWGCHSVRFRRRTKQKDVAVLGFRNQPRTFVVVELFFWLEGLLNMAWSMDSMDLFGVFGSVFWLHVNSWVETCAPAQTPPFVQYYLLSDGLQRYCPIPVVDFPFTSINFQIICLGFRRIFGVRQTTTESSRTADVCKVSSFSLSLCIFWGSGIMPTAQELAVIKHVDIC